MKPYRNAALFIVSLVTAWRVVFEWFSLRGEQGDGVGVLNLPAFQTN